MSDRSPLRRLSIVLLVALPLAASLLGQSHADSPTAYRATTGWIPWDHPGEPALAGSALDVSFLLDAPAGKHGFLRVKDDGFAFENGTEARFWGGNFFGEANFPDKADAERLSDIVSRSGANIVRMHHLDVVAPWSDKTVQRSLFGGQQPKTTRSLDPAMLDRFDYLVSCLKTRGVYVFLSHLSSRTVRPGDGFPGPVDATVGGGFKTVGMFDPFLIELQKEYLKQLLAHVNPYTGKALVDDPVLALTEVVNENTTLWMQEEGSFSIPTDYHRTMLRNQWNAWLRKRIGARTAVATRWATKDEGRIALADGEDPMAGTVAIPPAYRDVSRHHFSETRIIDTFAFLADLQAAYFHTMSSHLRALGLRCPLTGSNHWTEDLVDLKQNAAMGFVDRHAYWTHPQGSYNYEKGQGIEPQPMVKNPSGGIIWDLARRRVLGKPYTISEWHECLPNPYRAEGPPIMAAYAAMHGWHPMQYAYWGTAEKQPAMINAFEAMLDPTQTNLIPASALLFHRRDVTEFNGYSYAQMVARDGELDPLPPAERPSVAALMSKYGVAFDDGHLDRERVVDAGRIKEPHAALVRSPTAELTWDTENGVVTIEAPSVGPALVPTGKDAPHARTLGVAGFVGGRTFDFHAGRFEITTPFAVVMVSSVDGERIEESRRLLISTSANARWTGVRVSESGDRILATGHWPFLMQPVEGRMVLHLDNDCQLFGEGCERPPDRRWYESVTVYRLATNGQRLGTVAFEVVGLAEVERMHGWGLILSLEAANRCMHYEIVRQAPGPQGP